ncbi:MAG: hypothetical protein ACOC8C_02815 [Chloroflexota bacterium]
MQKLFEPGAVELADPRGDPNRVIEVQEAVEKLLRANQQRREGIRQELLEQGAWALPGLINATYVWMNDLRQSPHDQDALASLIAELAGDNPAAADLLFRYGILETPFSTPRSIAQKALKEIDWRPSDEDRRKLKKTLDRYRRLEDHQTVVELYDVLLSVHQMDDFSEALDVCKSWARKSLEPAGDLLKLLVQWFPEQATQVFTEVFVAIKDKYRDKNLARMLLDPLRYGLPTSWLQQGGLLEVSEDVLPHTRSGRHTAVEYLWEYAVCYCRKLKPGLWPDLFDRLHEQVLEQSNADIYRYWFEALGKAGEIEYVARQAQADAGDETWGIQAALQLLFLERSYPSARQALKDLQVDRPSRYDHAARKFEEITGHPKEKGDTEGGRRPVRPI